MDPARLLDGEVALVDRAVPPGPEAHLLFRGRPPEEVDDLVVGPVVEARVDAVAFEDGEADVAQRLAQLGHEGAPVGLAAAEEAAEVASPDRVLLVEGLRAIRRLGEMVGLPLLHLVVADELLVGGGDALRPAVLHAWLLRRSSA